MTRRDAAGRGAYLGGLLLVLLPCLAAGQRSDTIRVTFEEFPDTAPAGVTAKVPRPVGHPGTFLDVHRLVQGDRLLGPRPASQSAPRLA